MLSEFSLTWTDRLEFDSCMGRCSIDISGCTLLGQNEDVNIYMINSDKLHRRNLGSSSQPANRNLPLICIPLSLIRNIVQCLALLSVYMCDNVTVNGHEQPLTCCKRHGSHWWTWFGVTKSHPGTNKHKQTKFTICKTRLLAILSENSPERVFCVSCIKYNDNCYLPFQKSLKSDWIVGHSPNQNREKHETITFV